MIISLITCPSNYTFIYVDIHLSIYVSNKVQVVDVVRPAKWLKKTVGRQLSSSGHN
jgi:hypothetical protein